MAFCMATQVYDPKIPYTKQVFSHFQRQWNLILSIERTETPAADNFECVNFLERKSYVARAWFSWRVSIPHEYVLIYSSAYLEFEPLMRNSKVKSRQGTAASSSSSDASCLPMIKPVFKDRFASNLKWQWFSGVFLGPFRKNDGKSAPFQRFFTHEVFQGFVAAESLNHLRWCNLCGLICLLEPEEWNRIRRDLFL